MGKSNLFWKTHIMWSVVKKFYFCLFPTGPLCTGLNQKNAHFSKRWEVVADFCKKFFLSFKFWLEKSRLGIFFQNILKWFIHHSKDYLRYQKASMGRKVFIFVNKFEVCLFSMNLRAHKKHWVLFLRLKNKNIVKL